MTASAHKFYLCEWNLLLLKIFQSFVCCTINLLGYDDFITFFRFVKGGFH